MIRTLDSQSDLRLDTALIRAALRLLAHRTGLEEGALKVRVGREFETHRSHITPLSFETEGEVAHSAFYKAPRLPPSSRDDPTSWASLARSGLELGQAISGKYAAATRAHGIHIDEVLAADPERGHLITLAVPGRPMGSPITWAYTSQRREWVERALTDLGVAVSILERLPEGHRDPDDALEWKTLERSFGALGGLFSEPEIRGLERRMSNLYAIARSDGNAVLSHGDLSGSNVLIGSEGLGIVDFGWISRLRGYDVATFSYRLEYGSPLAKSWAMRLRDSLIEGYGNADIVNSASWRFVRTRRLLALMTQRRGKVLHGWRVSKGIDEIRRLL